MERYDIAIIGTGPAGVSAAITAKIRGRKILLIGNNKISDKVSKAHIIIILVLLILQVRNCHRHLTITLKVFQ